MGGAGWVEGSLIQRGDDVLDTALFHDEGEVAEAGFGDVLSAGDAGAGGREDDEIGGCPEAGGGDFRSVLVELGEEGAAGAHLVGTGAGAEVGGEGAVLGGAEGDVAAGAGMAVAGLQVMASDDTAHAVADEVEGAVGEVGVDVGGELGGELFEGGGAVVGGEAGGEDFAASGAEGAGQAGHVASGAVDAVDDDDRGFGGIDRGGGRIEGRQGDREPGDEFHRV